MLSPHVVAVRYAAFGAVATGVNLGAQFLSTVIYRGSYELFVAMILGTGAGLATKYLLDKRYIYYDASNSLRDHTLKFTLYSFTGLFTTAFFWSTEILSEAISDWHYMRYVGGGIGLAIGYFMKYHLDRRIVFRAR